MTTAKRILAVLLALVLCLGVFAACDANPAETTAPAGQGGAALSADGKTNAERYPIDFDGTLTVVTGKADADKADNWVRWEEWTGVDVEWVTTAQEQTPLLFLDEKQMPDMFFFTSGLTTPMVNEYGQGGLLINYMDYLDKMPNVAAR